MSLMKIGQIAGLIGLLVLSGCTHKCKNCLQTQPGCPNCGPGQPSPGAVNAPYGPSAGQAVPFNPNQGGLPNGAIPAPAPMPPGGPGLVPNQANSSPIDASARLPLGNSSPAGEASGSGNPEPIIQKPSPGTDLADARGNPGQSPSESVQLQAPQASGSAETIVQKPLTPTDPGDASPPLDIPNFALVKTRIATGLKPFPDGISWLKSKGYRTVIHLRAPGEIDLATGKLFQNQNLQYVPLEVSADRLNRELVEKFNQLVTDSSTQPLFVFDKDGSLAGPLWYLHFRLSEGVSEEKARLEITRLGYKLPSETDNKAMADAIQRVLQATNP